jgi:hypothetical protein
VTRSTEERAHRRLWKSPAVDGGGAARWCQYVGQMKRKGMEITCAWGIAQWRSQLVASWRWVAVGPYLSGGKINGEGERISCQTSPFIGDGERGGGCPSPVLIAIHAMAWKLKKISKVLKWSSRQLGLVTCKFLQAIKPQLSTKWKKLLDPLTCHKQEMLSYLPL